MKVINRYDINEEWAHSGIIKNCLFRNIWDIPIMEKTIKERFNGEYPVRKSIQTEFADQRGLLFQVDAIAYSTE